MQDHHDRLFMPFLVGSCDAIRVCLHILYCPIHSYECTVGTCICALLFLLLFLLFFLLVCWFAGCWLLVAGTVVCGEILINRVDPNSIVIIRLFSLFSLAWLSWLNGSEPRVQSYRRTTHGAVAWPSCCSEIFLVDPK